MTDTEDTYQIYRLTKRIVEKAIANSGKDQSGQAAYVHFEKAIKIFDSLDRGYAERYEKEKNDVDSSR